MTLKLEEIERLERKRTHSYWHLYPDAKYLLIGDRGILCDISEPHIDYDFDSDCNLIQVPYVPKPPTYNDLLYFFKSPIVFRQYLRARKFEVTEEFVEKASTDNNPLDADTGDEWDCLVAYTKEVIRLMWQEVENE